MSPSVSSTVASSRGPRAGSGAEADARGARRRLPVAAFLRVKVRFLRGSPRLAEAQDISPLSTLQSLQSRVLVLTLALTAAWAVAACHRTTATTTGVGSASAEAAAVDKLFAKWTTGGSPGCSVGISRHGTVLYQHGYGLANLDHQVPIAADTVFDAASVSKQFTAFSILLLAQRKQLSLDDDVGTYIPGWAKREHTVTVRHLVSHTSGGHDAFLLQGLAPVLTGGFADQIVDILARAPGLEFTPGSRFAYNNSGYTTLARIVERVSGQTFAAFTRANIFQPLGMADSHFHDDPSRIVPRRALGYQRDGDGFRLVVRSITDSLVGNAGLLTTTGDLLKWEQNFVIPRVGDRAILAEMVTPVVATGWSADSRYALGLEIAEHRGLRTIGHSGGDDGRRAHVLRYPDRELAIAVLCNLQDIDPARLIASIAEIYLAKDFPEQTRAPPRLRSLRRRCRRRRPRRICSAGSACITMRPRRWSAALRSVTASCGHTSG